MQTQVKGEIVFGIDVDAETRCGHYHGRSDVIAIRFHCCGQWYPCHACHEACADHEASVWPRQQWAQERAVLCGACGYQLTVQEYMDSNSTCPSCAAAFNPGCRFHYQLYFEGETN